MSLTGQSRIERRCAVCGQPGTLKEHIEKLERAHTTSDSVGLPPCTRCKGSGWMPSPGGLEGEFCPCGRCGGAGHELQSDEDVTS